MPLYLRGGLPWSDLQGNGLPAGPYKGVSGTPGATGGLSGGRRAILSRRRAALDDVKNIVAYAQDMSEFLKKSELTKRRDFVHSFVKEVKVKPGNALRWLSARARDE